MEARNLHALKDRSISTAFYHRPGKNHGLQDYQMQLMLLEQQSKKRLLIAKQEHALDARRWEHYLETGRWEHDAVETSRPTPDFLPGNSTSINDSTPMGKRHNMEPDPLSLLSDDVSSMDAVELQSYIERLQAKARQFGSTQKNRVSSRYQILYRILQEVWVSSDNDPRLESKLWSSFFDLPECVRGQGEAQVLRCQIPVKNFDLYLEQNKDVSFIVYRTYVEPNTGTSSERDTKIDSSDSPEQITESIRPVADILIHALEAILQSREEYADLLQKYRATSELYAPYLFMYHNRKDLDIIRENLDQSTQEQLQLFSDYVVQNHGSMYATADSLISQGMISPEYIDYLFKPGDVLVQRHVTDYRGWVACSWPRKISTEQIPRSLAESVKKGAPIPLYGSREASKRMENDTVLVHHWNIEAWHWDFDGNFQRKNDTLKFAIQAEDNHAKHAKNTTDHNCLNTQDEASQIEIDRVAIGDLRVFPLKYTSSEIVNLLRRRGKTFWKCRARRVVSYQGNEKDSMQNSVGFKASCSIALFYHTTIETT